MESSKAQAAPSEPEAPAAHAAVANSGAGIRLTGTISGTSATQASLRKRQVRRSTSGVLQACADFTIEDQACQLVRVPAPAPIGTGELGATAPDTGPLDGEIARFQLRGVHYALLAPMSVRMQRALHAETAAAAKKDFLKLLTERERQIVDQICVGGTTPQAAEHLGISEFTVRSHLKTIFCKLGVRSRGAMIYRYALALARSHANGGRRGM